jgi:fucose permease
MVTFSLLIIIYLSFISLGLPESLLGSAWPLMSGSFHVPLHYAGFISMIITGGAAIASVFSAKIIRRFDTGIVTAASVFITASALIGFSLSTSFLYICLCALPLGLGAGSMDAALNNYVALHYKAKHMSWLHCFWGVGASLGPIIMSSFLMHDSSWGMGYRAIGIAQFCLVLLLFISLPLWRKNAPLENPAGHGQIGFATLFRIAGVKEALMAFFFYCGIETITGIWGASFLVTVKGVSPEIAARWVALYYIGITAGRFISGFITMKLSNRQMVRLGQIIIGCGIIVLVLPFENNTVLPGLFMIGLGCAPTFPSLLHETPKNFGKEYSQAIVGIQMGSAYIGMAIMPPLFGWLASFTGFHIFPVFIGILLIIKIMMIETLNKKVDRIGQAG